MTVVTTRLKIRNALKKAFLAGFNNSVEGWNGEYPGDHEDNPQFMAGVESVVDELLNKTVGKRK